MSRAEAGPAPVVVSRAVVWTYARGAVALVLIALATQLPLWHAELQAPQYPQGLEMVAYGDEIKGDLSEINNLNHYIGMKPFRWNDIAERRLWPLAVVVAAAAVIVATVATKRRTRLAAIIVAWAVPIGIIVDLQFRLYQYGHDLHEGAALRVGEFTVWVFGPTKVWNFTTWSTPGTGLLAFLGAAFMISFAPPVFRFVKDRVVRFLASDEEPAEVAA